MFAVLMTLCVLGAAADAATLAHPSPRFPKGMSAMVLPPTPRGLKTWKSRECVSCHPTEARQHGLSGHAVAAANPVFEFAQQAEGSTWCVSCHAPLAASGDDGISCAACHAEKGGVAARTLSHRAPHAVIVSPALTDGRLCAGCHQFGFALQESRHRVLGLATEMQQDTYAEWRGWADRTHDLRSCVDCHMPRGNHDLGGRHRAEALKASVRVVAKGLRLDIATQDVGHRFPTGDVMRWVSVEVAPDLLFEDFEVVTRFKRTLALSHHSDEPMERPTVVADNRLFASGTTAACVDLPALVRGRRSVAYRVVYHLVAEHQEGDALLPASLFRIILAAGAITPAEAKEPPCGH